MLNTQWSKHICPALHNALHLYQQCRVAAAITQGLQQRLVALPLLNHLVALQGVRRRGLANHQGLAQQPDNDVDARL